MIGLSIHAFLEGMPLVDLDGDIHQGLLYGIVLHNIPIALVLVGLFINNRYGFWRSFSLLLLFAVMTPLGSLLNLYLLPPNETLQSIIMGIVVGILLHVAVNILFDHDHNNFTVAKLLLIILAFVAAYFTPGCPEIYPFQIA
jgi:zinc transporter ZupT